MKILDHKITVFTTIFNFLEHNYYFTIHLIKNRSIKTINLTTIINQKEKNANMMYKPTGFIYSERAYDIAENQLDTMSIQSSLGGEDFNEREEDHAIIGTFNEDANKASLTPGDDKVVDDAVVVIIEDEEEEPPSSSIKVALYPPSVCMPNSVIKINNIHFQDKKYEYDIDSASSEDESLDISSDLENLMVVYDGADEDDKQSLTKKPTISTRIFAFLKDVIGIYTDQSGSWMNLVKGLLLVALFGTLLGLVMPTNDTLSSPYKYFSSIIGYTYFIAWTVLFYPQIITNYQRKVIDGLSTDSMIMGLLKSICYAIYNAFFFWSSSIRQEYKEQNPGSEITVMSNDVAFAIYSMLLCVVIMYQIVIYGGLRSQPISWTCISIVALSVTITGLYIMFIVLDVPGFTWIKFLYMMAAFKLTLSIMHYIPQLVLNFRRKSTSGKLNSISLNRNVIVCSFF